MTDQTTTRDRRFMSDHTPNIADDVLSPVTEEQKTTLLGEVQKLYEETAASEYHYVWSEDEDGRQEQPVMLERCQIPTPEEWLGEETGERDALDGWTTYSDLVFEMAKKFVSEAYRRRFGDDWQDDGNLDNAACTAESKLSEWVESRLKDVSTENKATPGGTFKVVAKAAIAVDIQVEAKSRTEAEEKASIWDGGFPSGDCKVGVYIDDNGNEVEDNDDDIMYWQIVDVEFVRVLQVEELECDGASDSTSAE